MHPILADSIDFGVLMILLMGGGLAVSVLALIALIPAWQGSRAGTLVLAGPGFIWGVAATIFCAWGFVHDGLGDPNFELMDFLGPWIVLAGPSLATSLLAVGCLWFRRGRAKQTVDG